MGSFLDKPQTDKTTLRDEGNGLRVGFSEMQGWRIDMEDAHAIDVHVEDAPDCSWFGVFDGHGGSLVSGHCGRKTLAFVKDTPEYKEDHKNPDKLKGAIRRGFLKLDEHLKKLDEVMKGEDHSGSTAITAYITPKHIIVGNCGDSRCVLASDSKAVEMSEDHKPTNPGERKRIEKAGGSVTMKRVNGDLAVSRSLGDFSYKMQPIPAEEQPVSAEPECKVWERTDKDQYLILACDGIWDVMTNEQAVEFVLEKVAQGCDDLGVLAELMLDACLAYGSRDNMTACIIALPGAKRPDAAAIEKFKKEMEDMNDGDGKGDVEGGGGGSAE